jgi:hypothetical protein
MASGLGEAQMRNCPGEFCYKPTRGYLGFGLFDKARDRCSLPLEPTLTPCWKSSRKALKIMPEPPGGDSRHPSTERRTHPVGRLWIKKEICGGGEQCPPPAAGTAPQQGRDAGRGKFPAFHLAVSIPERTSPMGVFPGCWCQVRARPDADASAFAGIPVEISGFIERGHPRPSRSL